MDQNTFINTYIDIIINSLQEHLKANLQLQTQVKVNEFVVAEKDMVIESLTKQLNENQIAEDWKTKYEAAEANYSGKIKHMDGLFNQVNDMKRIILERDIQIKNLHAELDELKNAKKVINTRNKKALVEEKATEKTLDDF